MRIKCTIGDMSAKKEPGQFKKLSFKKLKLLYTSAFSALVVTYLGISFLSVPSRLVLKKYNLTITSYRWLILPIVILIVATWLVSFYGSMRFKSYSEVIKKSRDGHALDFISTGLLVLTIALPFSAVLGSIFNIAIGHHPEFMPRLTIIKNVVGVALLGLAFILIAKGANLLQNLIQQQKRVLSQAFWVPLFIIASTLYSYLIITRPGHVPLAQQVYFLPNWLLLLMIVIPYLYIWYCGLNAAYNVFRYKLNVRGRLYKSALGYLAVGILMVIASSVVTEILVTASSHLSRLNLTPVLWIIYSLLVVDGAGYVLIAIGAKKLHRLEEV